MIEGDRGIALRQIGTLFRAGTFAGMGDGPLLDHFLARRGEAGELAFAVLVERHGPMVLRVCRGVLKDRGDAEDAFQATFLALARGAGSIRRRDSVASWLHGAALRVSACARAAGARRTRHEGRFAAMRAVSSREEVGDDLGAALHEEVGRLPAHYRAAVLLCDLQGLPLDEAARHLGCPVGTVKSRVARGRQRLRDRLIRRGIVPTAAAVGAALGPTAGAAVRPTLAESTARLAAGFAAGRPRAGMLAATVEWLARMDSRRIIMRRFLAVPAGFATIGDLAIGATLLGQQGPGRPTEPEPRRIAANQTTYVKTYAVVDLVGTSTNADGTRPKIDMDPLIELITTSVAPGTWRVLDSKGRDTSKEIPGQAPGTITPFELSVNLIIRHTSEVHDQVAGRLEQLRRVLAAREANSTRTDRADGAPGAIPGDAAPRISDSAPAGMPGMMGMTDGGNPPPSAPGMAGAMPAGGMMPGMALMLGSADPPAAWAGMMSAMNSMRGKSGMMGTTPANARKGVDARQTETERRLRAIEEKLDRILKDRDASPKE